MIARVIAWTSIGLGVLISAFGVMFLYEAAKHRWPLGQSIPWEAWMPLIFGACFLFIGFSDGYNLYLRWMEQRRRKTI